ncbi:MAG TPA: YtxH domain-containing protein [Chitinophagaceae bacterium]|nr:YtxH domain-containing protein [Chitinophagaceae bacterium]
MSTKNLLIAFASGIVAGAVVTLLTAPASGSETRGKIADATGKMKTRFFRFIGRASDELDELEDLIETQSEGLKDDVKQRILKLIAAVKTSSTHMAEVKADA